MPQPKILRRCPTCGASIRDQAFFCPQCGNELSRKTSPPKSEIHDTEEIILQDGLTLTEADFQAQKKVSEPKSPSPSVPKAEPDQTQPLQPGGLAVSEQGKPKGHGGQRALGEVGARIQRATTKARDVEENVVHRVQKFREISSVMLDEAGYDPSLRFVLVAAALFVLFVVILLLNRLIG
jgi:hypothetical protein